MLVLINLYIISVLLGDSPAMWGVINTFGSVHSGWSVGNGSGSVTSSATPDKCSFSKAL